MLFIKEQVYDFNKENINYLFNKKYYNYSKININLIVNQINNILQDKLTFDTTVVTFAILFYSQPVLAKAITTDVPWADKIGNLFLHYGNAVCMWVCIIKAVTVIIQAVSQDNVKECWKKIMGYAIAAFAVKLIPEIFVSIGQ